MLNLLRFYKRERLRELSELLEDARELLEAGQIPSRMKARLSNAQQLLAPILERQSMLGGVGEVTTSGVHAADVQSEPSSQETLCVEFQHFSQQFYKALIAAQVEYDMLRHIDVDPMVGWVELRNYSSHYPGMEQLIVDTQLARYYFNPAFGGALTEFDYKPRRANLTCLPVRYDVAPSESSQQICTPEELLERDFHPLTFTDALVPASEWKSLHQLSDWFFSQHGPARPSVTKQTPGLLGLRFVRKLGFELAQGSTAANPSEGSSEQILTQDIDHDVSDETIQICTVTKDFTFKAGVGSYLQHATTGFSVEIWLECEAELPADVIYLLRWNLQLPSNTTDGLSMRPLLSVGGVADEHYAASDAQVFKAADFKGGLFGLGLVDGVAGLTLEVRSSRPLSGLFVEPLYRPESESSEKCYQGLALTFALTACELVGDENSETLFLSIV